MHALTSKYLVRCIFESVSTHAAQDVRVALKKCHAEYSVQNAKDKKTYGGMFASNEGLYSKKEEEEMKKAPPPQEDKLSKEVSDAELRARAKAMGVDLVSEFHLSVFHEWFPSLHLTRPQLDVVNQTHVAQTGQSKGPQGDGGPCQSASRRGNAAESRGAGN